MSDPTGRHASLAVLSQGLLRRWKSMDPALRGEYAMSFNRVGFGTLMLGVATLFDKAMPVATWVPCIVAWLACSLGLLGCLHSRVMVPRLRRCLAIVLDVTGTTTMLIAGGQSAAFLWVVYQWIIIGNGFRFGRVYTLAGSFLSIAGFGVVIASDPFWREHRSLSMGLLSGLIVLPAYSFLLIRQLNKARELAERAAASKSLFLASISHELRTPLNAIIGTAELLRDTPLDPAQAEMVGTINAAADVQLSLVQDVLTFTSMEMGQARLSIAAFDLVGLVGRVRAIIAPTARQKGLLLNTYITARTPLQVEGDERRLREVLLNIMSNAVKFTARGSVTLSVDGVLTPDGRVRLYLEVQDTGIGIKTEAQAKIFNLFTQADETVLDRFGGTGLGLALCDRLIRLMNGAIGVHSIPDAGSSFWIDLLLKAATAPEPAAPEVRLVHVSGDAEWRRSSQQQLASYEGASPDIPAIAVVQSGCEGLVPASVGALIEVVDTGTPGLPPRPVRETYATSVSRLASRDEWQRAIRIAEASCSMTAASSSRAAEPAVANTDRLAGMKVLIADDNAINRTIIAKMLDRYGVQPVFAADGEQALAVLTEGDIDVALLDVNMPIINGIDVAKLYGFSSLGRRQAPLIGLTADATAATRERCLQAGMERCLIKPVRTAELAGALLAASPAPTSPPRLVPSVPAPVLNLSTLKALEDLGGAEFVARLVDDYGRDAASLLAEIEVACSLPDVGLFRTSVHSLASISANMGATALAERCGRLQHIAEAEFVERNGTLVGELRALWTGTSAAFAEAGGASEGLCPSTPSEASL